MAIESYGTHLKQRIWVWLEKPVPIKGFQGFHYVTDQIREQFDDAERENETERGVNEG